MESCFCVSYHFSPLSKLFSFKRKKSNTNCCSVVWLVLRRTTSNCPLWLEEVGFSLSILCSRRTLLVWIEISSLSRTDEGKNWGGCGMWNAQGKQKSNNNGGLSLVEDPAVYEMLFSRMKIVRRNFQKGYICKRHPSHPCPLLPPRLAPPCYFCAGWRRRPPMLYLGNTEIVVRIVPRQVIRLAGRPAQWNLWRIT
jgi:hypothetical protein